MEKRDTLQVIGRRERVITVKGTRNRRDFRQKDCGEKKAISVTFDNGENKTLFGSKNC